MAEPTKTTHGCPDVAPRPPDARPADLPAGTSDPTGRSAHEPGAKLDAGKNRLALVLAGFAPGLVEVGKVGTFGANKYTPNGWKEVPDAMQRYQDAMMRHLTAYWRGESNDPDSGLPHLAHATWNALAVLTFATEDTDK